MPKTTTSIVLLSGGMDSTTALALADRDTTVIGCLAVDYGQRHSREIGHARSIAEHYGVPFTVLDLSSWGSLLTGSSLTDPKVDVPEGHYAAPTMAATIVPNRNATMLMAAVGVAQSLGASEVHTAVHAGDHHVYPDCRPEFIDAANTTAQVATEGQVRIVAPFVHFSKAEICATGAALDAPLGETWSCYQGGELHCGKCGTCVERIEAFTDSGVPDPTQYATA